jgi:hypothetical protein
VRNEDGVLASVRFAAERLGDEPVFGGAPSFALLTNPDRRNRAM